MSPSELNGNRSNAAARAPNVHALALHTTTRDNGAEVRPKSVWTTLKLGNGVFASKNIRIVGVGSYSSGADFVAVDGHRRQVPLRDRVRALGERQDHGRTKCVDKCPGWWYSSDGGLCVEEIWRRSTAIAVTITVAVVIAAVILTVILVKRRTKGSHEAKPAGVMRDNVVNS